MVCGLSPAVPLEQAATTSAKAIKVAVFGVRLIVSILGGSNEAEGSLRRHYPGQVRSVGAF
jgi:hypothetical protein